MRFLKINCIYSYSLCVHDVHEDAHERSDRGQLGGFISFLFTCM